MSVSLSAALPIYSSSRLLMSTLAKVTIGFVLLTCCNSETATVNAEATATVTDDPKTNAEPQHDGKSVAEWIKLLENGSPVEHVQAVEALAILERQSEAAWRKLLDTLPSPEDPLADLHYTGMRYVAQPGSDALLNRLRTVDGNAFLMICRILDAAPRLLAIDPELLHKSCAAMEFQNGHGASTISSFLLHTQTEHSLMRTEVRRIYSSELPQVRRVCLQILGSLDNANESLATFSAATDDKDQSVRLEAVLSLLKVYKQAPNAKAVVLLLKLLQDPDVVVSCLRCMPLDSAVPRIKSLKKLSSVSPRAWLTPHRMHLNSLCAPWEPWAKQLQPSFNSYCHYWIRQSL